MAAAGALFAERYRLTGWIAGGGMGEVWRGRDELLGRDVAVKVLRPEHADDAVFRARLRAEARAAAAISSPAVVSVYDFGEQLDATGRCVSFLVMELVAGEALSAVLGREGALDAQRVTGIVQQAAAGLAAAHRQGLIHRDVKPANLLLAGDGSLKVADFGVARAADAASLTATGVVLGTARYMSPEQVEGKPATAASDVYSLGVVAHHCLTGRAPFTGDGEIATALAHLRDAAPPLPTDVPPGLRELVASMLDRDPDRRPTAAEVAHRLATGGSGPTVALPASMLPTAVLPAAGLLSAAAAGADLPTTDLPTTDLPMTDAPMTGPMPRKSATPGWVTRRGVALSGAGLVMLAALIGSVIAAGGGTARTGGTPRSGGAVNTQGTRSTPSPAASAGVRPTVVSRQVTPSPAHRRATAVVSGVRKTAVPPGHAGHRPKPPKTKPGHGHHGPG